GYFPYLYNKPTLIISTTTRDSTSIVLIKSKLDQPQNLITRNTESRHNLTFEPTNKDLY
ncbi:18571_t:CDS:2, partial [Gigaspora rosea]